MLSFLSCHPLVVVREIESLVLTHSPSRGSFLLHSFYCLLRNDELPVIVIFTCEEGRLSMSPSWLSYPVLSRSTIPSFHCFTPKKEELLHPHLFFLLNSLSTAVVSCYPQSWSCYCELCEFRDLPVLLSLSRQSPGWMWCQLFFVRWLLCILDVWQTPIGWGWCSLGSYSIQSSAGRSQGMVGKYLHKEHCCSEEKNRR